MCFALFEILLEIQLNLYRKYYTNQKSCSETQLVFCEVKRKKLNILLYLNGDSLK